MGKKGKSLRRDKKKSQKRAQRDANRAKYAEWRRTGQNSKSKRARQNSKKKKNTKSHPFGNCGNIGCNQCSSSYTKKITSKLNKVQLRIKNTNAYRKRVNQEPITE